MKNLRVDSIIVFILSFAFYLYYQRIHPLFGDEFNILVQAARVLDGQVPYRDFFQFITPGSIYLSALWLKIFGKSISSIRVFSSLEGAVIALLVYTLVKKITSSRTIIVIVLLFSLCFSTTFWFFVSHHWLSTITALSAIYFMSEYVEKGRKIFLISTGLFSGITFFILQNKGVLIFIALCFFIVLDVLLFKKGMRTFSVRLKHLTGDVVILSIFYVTPIVFLIIYLFFKDALGDFIYDSFLWVLGPYSKFNAYPNYFFMGNYAIFQILKDNSLLPGLLRARDQIVIGYLPPIITALSIYYLIKFYSKDSENIRWKNAVLFTITTLFMFSSILYRSDQVHITYIFPFVLLLLANVFDGWLARWREFKGFQGLILLALLFIFFFYGAYGAVSRLRFAHNFKYPFDTRIGRFYAYDKSVADYYDNLFRGVEEKVKDNRVFVYLWSPFIYFVSEKKNPTKYDSVIPGYNTNEQLEEVIDDLERQNLQFVITDGVDEGILKDPYLFSYPGAKINKDNPLNLYLRERYEEIAEIRFDENLAYKILRRRDAVEK
jgi:hypothetical protein